MKRSEMLKSIQKYLDHQEFYGYSATADYVLDLVEEAGMLPPPKDTDVINSRLIYVYYDEDTTNIIANDDYKLDIKASKLWDEEG